MRGRKQPSSRYSYKGEVRTQTEMAWLFAFDEYPDVREGEGTAWLPKSECSWHPDRGEAKGNDGYMMVPEWLAKKLDILP